MAGKTDVLRYVASFGADVNHRDNHGYSALYWASKQGNLDVVKCLLQRKATDVNLTDTDGWSPLRMASKEGHIDIVKFLIQNGANINQRSNLGFLPIDCAANEETKNILKNAEALKARHKFFIDTDVAVVSEQPSGKKTPQSRRVLRHSLDSKFKIDTRDKSPASSRGTTPRATPKTTPRTTPKSPSHLEWSKMQSGMTSKNLGKITGVSSSNNSLRSVNGAGGGGGTNETTVSPLDPVVHKEINDIQANRAIAAAAAAAAAARLGLNGGGNSEKSALALPSPTDQAIEKKKKNRRATYDATF